MRYRSYYGPNLTPLWVLIAANVLMFLVTFIAPRLVFLLGLSPVAFWDRPWTIITSMFVHGGIWHVTANMFTLFFFGRYLSALVGEKRFLIVYFVGGIVGGILYLLLAPPLAIAVGASGAVFAAGGALTVMRPKIRVFVIPIPVPIPLWVAVIGGFLILSFFTNVAWQAHLGGMVVGLISGYFFRKRERAIFF